MSQVKKVRPQDSSTMDVETTTFISTENHRRVEEPIHFTTCCLHEERPKTKETSKSSHFRRKYAAALKNHQKAPEPNFHPNISECPFKSVSSHKCLTNSTSDSSAHTTVSLSSKGRESHPHLVSRKCLTKLHAASPPFFVWMLHASTKVVVRAVALLSA